MVEFPFKMDSEIELFLTFPFHLGLNIYPISSIKRKEIFLKISQKLNQVDSKFRWSCKEFNEDNHIPSLVRKNKVCFLLGESIQNEELSIWLQESNKYRDLIQINSVEESVWYLDWGLGSVDFKIKINIKNFNHLGQLLEFGEFIHHNLRDKGKMIFYREWENIAVPLIKDLLVEYQKHQYLEKSSFEFSGKLNGYGINLIVKSNEFSSIQLSEAEFNLMIKSFIGRAINKDEDYTAFSDVLSIAEGYDGQFAAFNGSISDIERTINRVRWLWRLITLYWSNLSILSEILSNRVINRLALKDKELTEDLKKLRKEHLAVYLFLFETNPTNLCDDALDMRIYKGVWVAWQTDNLTNEIKEQLEFLKTYFSESINLLTSEMQDKINWILFILNILTFSTVIATIISTFDVENKIIPPLFRILLISIGTIVFTLLSVIFLIKGYYKYKK